MYDENLKIYFKKLNNPYLDFSEFSISEKGIKQWYNNLGFEEVFIKDLFKKSEINQLNQLIHILEKNTPIQLKRILVSDFFYHPKKLIQILNDRKLLNSYARVLAMSSSYRTDIDFLKKVSNNSEILKINTVENVTDSELSKGVEYEEKIIEIPFSSGLRIKGKFVDFKDEIVYEKLIPKENLFKSKDYLNNYAFMHFQELLFRNQRLQSLFEEKVLIELLNREITSISNSESYLIPNYSWYHTVEGSIQLIKTSVLKNTPHTDARSLISGILF